MLAVAPRFAYSSRVNQPPGAVKRVLIAEDDDHMRDVLQDLLSGAGYSVIAAEDGLEALDWLSRLSVDLLIVDAGDDLDDVERERLHAALAQAHEEIERGEGIPAEQVIESLRRRP